MMRTLLYGSGLSIRGNGSLMEEDEVNEHEAEFRTFHRLVRQCFTFLHDKYGFIEAEATLMLPGMWVYLRNSTTQVAVQFEYGSGVWVTIGRLTQRDGRVVGGEQYNLNYLLSLRAADLERNSRLDGFDETEIEGILRERAAALRQSADDVLRGEFGVFARLKQVRAERSAQRFSH